MARKLIINGGAIRPTGLLFTLRQFSQKLFDNFFSIFYLCMKLPKEGTNELSKVGFD